MKYLKKLSLIAMVAICMLSLTACGKEEPEVTATILYKYGKIPVTYGEFYIYAKTIEEDYQKTYGNGIWSLELTTEDGKSSVKDVTIMDIIANINRVKVLNLQVEDLNVALSDGEKAEIENETELFYKGLTEKDKKDSEVTKDLVLQVMEENLLAKKVYDQIISEYDFEISEEQARMSTFYDMVFECYDLKSDGTVEEYTEEKKAAQLERANEALSSLAQEEDVTYDAIVDKYDLEFSSSYTMSRTEMVEEYGESIADKILSLSDGEVSVVIQSQYGYHIFKMLEANNEDLTKKNKENIISQKQKEYFNTIYTEWAQKYDSRFDYTEDVNQELLKSFPFSESQE